MVGFFSLEESASFELVVVLGAPNRLFFYSPCFCGAPNKIDGVAYFFSSLSSAAFFTGASDLSVDPNVACNLSASLALEGASSTFFFSNSYACLNDNIGGGKSSSSS